MKITFPNKTAQEIMNDCNNILGNGKLLYGLKSWYKNEDFFTKEKCRPITVEIEIELIGKNKDWNECKELVKKEEGEMLNFPEMIYFYQEYFKQTGKYIDEYEWSWTSSRSSDGRLVDVGRCASDGVGVSHDRPVDSRSDLGVRFSSSALPVAKAGQAEAIPLVTLNTETLEKRLEKIEAWIRKESNFINPFE